MDTTMINLLENDECCRDLKEKTQNSSKKRKVLIPFGPFGDHNKVQVVARSNELHNMLDDTDLIGDFTRPFCLPITSGRHADLRYISVDTLRNLILGDFIDRVASFKVIDCRYPYEFTGGHICGALNFFTQEQIVSELMRKETEGDETKRNILVFHCEFSSERGPKLQRFLRNFDRNNNVYPSLKFPEVYLLHGGYKEFFESNADLCDPMSYRTMRDPKFTDEYNKFHAETKKNAKSRSRLMM